MEMTNRKFCAFGWFRAPLRLATIYLVVESASPSNAIQIFYPLEQRHLIFSFFPKVKTLTRCGYRVNGPALCSRKDSDNEAFGRFANGSDQFSPLTVSEKGTDLSTRSSKGFIHDSRRYMTRCSILQHALNEKQQALVQSKRRVLILQDLIQKLESSINSETSKCQSQIPAQDRGSVGATRVVNDVEAGRKEAAVLPSAERIRHSNVEDRLKKAIRELQTNNLLLVKELEHSTSSQSYASERTHSLTNQLWKQKILFEREREARERDFRSFQKQLSCYKNDLMEMEKILFEMEKELKSSKTKFEMREEELQDAILLEKKKRHKLRMKLEDAHRIHGEQRDIVDSGKEEHQFLALPEREKWKLSEHEIQEQVRRTEAVQIAEAAVHVSHKREETLTARLQIVQHELDIALRDKLDFERKESEARDKLAGVEKQNAKLKTQLVSDAREYSKKKVDFTAERNRLVQKLKQRETAIGDVEKKKDGISAHLLQEQTQRVQDLDRQQARYERLMKEQRMSLEARIEVLQIQLKESVPEMKGEREPRQCGSRFIFTLAATRKRVGQYGRRLFERVTKKMRVLNKNKL